MSRLKGGFNCDCMNLKCQIKQKATILNLEIKFSDPSTLSGKKIWNLTAVSSVRTLEYFKEMKEKQKGRGVVSENVKIFVVGNLKTLHQNQDFLYF